MHMGPRVTAAADQLAATVTARLPHQIRRARTNLDQCGGDNTAALATLTVHYMNRLGLAGTAGLAAAALLKLVEQAHDTDAYLALLADLAVRYDPCDLDHHGYCQEHDWFQTDPPCPIGRAKALVTS